MEKENPLVSIIVRTKDRPKLLRRALQSIAAQTYRPLEVVLVNDGGCGLNAEELKSLLGDVSLSYIALTQNKGRAHAGNLGIRNTRGAYIGFLDDDDALYPDHVSILTWYLENSTHRVVYTDAEVVYLADVHGTEEVTETESYPRESIDFVYETLLLQNYISFMCPLFHRTVLLESGGFDETFELCEDWDLLIRIGYVHPFHHIRKVTAKYSLWSKESQVTIGNEKLSPYRVKILTKHSGKITPQVLYQLMYEGRWLGSLAMRETITSLEDKVMELEEKLDALLPRRTASLFPKEIRPLPLPEVLGNAASGGGDLGTLPMDQKPSHRSWDDLLLVAEKERTSSGTSYPVLSVILRIKNEGKTLTKVLDAIATQDYPGKVEVVVVDSGSTDDTLSIASQHGCKIIEIPPDEFTFGAALNIGYRAAEGEVLVNLSGHSIPVDSYFLKNLVAPYEDPFVMATFGRNIPLPEGCPSEARDLDIWYPDKFLDVPERFSNGNASVRKAAWEKIPFNESVTGSEDILWADEIIKRGFQIIYVPNAPVYHSHSSSLAYAFRRRFRETKALATNGHQHGMSFIDVLTWTVRQTVADFRYVRQKGYRAFWYFHVLPYRFSQVLGMYAGTERREKIRETVLRELRVLKTGVIGYYHKSVRVIHNEGWGTFFFKAKRKLLTKLHIMQVSLEHSEIVLPAVKKLPSPRKFKVIFVVDPVGPLTNHFRAYNMKEYLALLDLESEIMSETSLNYQVITTADIVVLCRVFMNPHIEKLVETCRTLRIPVLFDADDFVIDPVIVEQISSLDGITEYEKSLHREGLRKHRQSFLAADFFTAPTHYLADIGKALGKPSFIIRNGLSVAQMETSRAILDIKGSSPSHDAGVKIGYFSGSKSHEKDFSAVVPALVRILEEFPRVSLYIGGYLELDSTLEKFHDRVKRLPFVDISRLPYNLAKVDINIAPLEVNNPFCEAKSELKYFDAGLLKIPTVASPTDAYRCAIQHGVNGYLAGSSEDWYDFLKALVEDAGLRAMMGERAYEHVLNSYAPNAMAVAVKNVYEEVITQYRKEREISEDALKISFVVPGPEQGSGGLNKVFTAARYLSEFGHSVCLYFLNDGKVRSHEQLKEFVFAHYFDPKSEIILGTDAISSCDILCATSWKTAYAVQEKRTQAAQLFYFVQDIESLFFPMGDDYLKAENTYRFGFSHVTYGPWCKKILRERYKAKADSIPFSLDKTIYYPRAVEKEKTKRVLFFSRPEMTRRCFWLGLEALAIFHRRNPEVIITLFGSEEITHHHIPFPHENLGVLSKEELAHLYSGADVGVAFSTTNPSLVPFEMMACGCPVVDLDYGDNYVNYGSSENIKLVRPSPQAIAGGIEELIRDDRLRYQFAEKGYQYVIEFPDDHEVFKTMEEIFLAALNPSVLPHQECPPMKESSQRCR